MFEMKVAAVEALLRWDDPHHGVISPMRFIPSAEHSGLIGPTGDWVIDTACAQMRAWLDLALEVRVAVNVALLQFRDVDRLRTCLAHCGVPPSQLIVEITESTAMRATECVEPVLERCSSSASRWRSTTSGWATAEQQKMIDERGSTCYGQGFHLARPMTPDRIPEILRAR